MNEQQQTDRQSAGTWLSGEVRVPRQLLLAGGILLLILFGIALD